MKNYIVYVGDKFVNVKAKDVVSAKLQACGKFHNTKWADIKVKVKNQ